MAKYNFSVTSGKNTFEVTGCDSFEEAVAKVEKGMYDYSLMMQLRAEKAAEQSAKKMPIEQKPESTGSAVAAGKTDGTQTN